MINTMLKIRKGLSYILSRLCTLLLIAMTVLVLMQVGSRYLFNAPLAFTEELVRYLLIWTGFIGAAYAFSSREHMALIYLRDKLPAQQQRIIKIFVDALILLFAAVIMVYGGTKLAISAQMEYSALLGISRALVYSMAPISGVFIIFAQIINLYEDFSGQQLSKVAALEDK